MYGITIENKFGEKLQLTDNVNYKTKVTGLNPTTSDIVTTQVANYGGARYVTSKQQTRNIVLTIYINEPVEANRINLYKYIKSDDWIRFYYKNNTRSVYIDGYVESFEIDLFTQPQTAQVSIICPKPQFLDMENNESIFSTTTEAFSFPFWANDNNKLVLSTYTSNHAKVVNNESDDDVGFIYKIHCTGAVVNPMIYLEDTREYLKINRIFKSESIITINTLDGQKSLTFEYKGKIKNIINDLDMASKWLKLKAGYNNILQTAESGIDNMLGTLIYTNEYEGV